MLDHNIIPALIYLRFDLVAHNQKKLVFGLTSNVSEHLRRNFLALNIFTGTYGLDDIGPLSVIFLVLDTMAV